jgi:hypothetical protein
MEIPTPVRPAPAGAQEPGPPEDMVSLGVEEATIPPRSRDGRPWGEGGEALPDPYVIVFLGDEELLRTESRSNTLHPSWSDQKPHNYRIPLDGVVRVEIWDESGLVSHPLCSRSITHLHSSADVGTYEGNCDSGARFVLLVEPAASQLGLGFSYEVTGEGLRITRVEPASPAGRLKLSVGDTIVSIGERSVGGLDRAQAINLVDTGAKGGLRCKVQRENGKVEAMTLREGPLYVPNAERSYFK